MMLVNEYDKLKKDNTHFKKQLVAIAKMDKVEMEGSKHKWAGRDSTRSRSRNKE